MNTENLSTLKIHKLTQAQYDRELAAGRIDENALYLTPNEEIDLTDVVYSSEESVDTFTTGKIKTLFSDEEKTEVLLPRTKVGAVFYDDGTSLEADIGVIESNVNQLNDEINDIQTQLDSKVSTSRKINGKALNLDVSLSASDVGAAETNHGNHVPAIETANNAKFLRNDNTWQTVTPANIGARAETFTYASKNGGDCNTYVNETHLFVFNFTNKPTAYNYGWFDVWRASGNGFSPNGAKPIIMQRFICWNTYSRAWRFSTDSGATWSEWAYDNPPNNLNTEYLTTEYYLGSPVKTKIINCGTVSSGQTLTFAHGLNISRLVRNNIMVGRYSLPYMPDGNPNGQYSISGYVNQTDVIVKNGSSNGSYEVYAQIWYTNT